MDNETEKIKSFRNLLDKYTGHVAHWAAPSIVNEIEAVFRSATTSAGSSAALNTRADTSRARINGSD